MSGELIVSMVAPPWSEAALTDLPDGTEGWACWPCPRSRFNGGAGGMTATACGSCGGAMASSAGSPHEGRIWCPVIAHHGVWWHDPNRTET